MLTVLPLLLSSLTAPAVVLPPGASWAEQVAARDLARYGWERTGIAWEVADAASPPSEPAVFVCRRDRPIAKRLLPVQSAQLRALGPDEYLLAEATVAGRAVQLVIGGDDRGVLYGAYRLAEHWGLRAYLHGDSILEARVCPEALPRVTEHGKPLFALRGIQPFHDFPEGPDWWGPEEYKAVLGQLPKMGMNFLGLHTYPEGVPAEPTVWIGLPRDLREDGSVAASYPASYQNTLRQSWGYRGQPTSSWHCGAAQLFERDDWGAPLMWGRSPQPSEPAVTNEMFDDALAMFEDAFPLGRALGVQLCIGTESPLGIPGQLRQRLTELGLEPGSLETRTELYEGIFRRAARYPVDWYWLWTPEGWTWSGTTPEQVAATLDDIRCAIEARDRTGLDLKLATCGWVLGPQYDRGLFDRELPPEVSLSCINRSVGRSPVEPGFAEVKREGKWAIPWLEDDPTLTTPQLWAGRMREDARDALRYGCNGLMGIHWRTRVLAVNASAIAQAAWRQSDWGAPHQGPEPPREGALGGQVANYAASQFADTEQDVLYRTVRYNLGGYRLALPDGNYTVTLRFCEPHYDSAGMREFGVSVQGRRVLENLDAFARVGKDRALDFRYEAVAVTDGWLRIDFHPIVEFPCIAAIEVEGEGVRRGIDCGGPGEGIFAADPDPLPGGPSRGVDTLDLYRDWASVEFGPEASEEIGELFARLDGRFPLVSTWTDGPGGLTPDPAPWETAREGYAFVDEMEALAPRVRGALSRDRFDYWLTQLRYTRTQAEVRCRWGAFLAAFEAARSTDARPVAEEAQEHLLATRVELVQAVTRAYDLLLGSVSNTGELGALMAWETRIAPSVLFAYEPELEGMLDRRLPPEAVLPTEYRGPLRAVVLSPRTAVTEGEDLALRALVLSPGGETSLTLSWRPLGGGQWQTEPVACAGRGVFLPRIAAEEVPAGGVEWYVTARAGGATSVWPASAPARGASVSRYPALRRSGAS